MSDLIIEFKGVSFSYGDRSNALTNVNVSIHKGKKIALLGGNGAGKSTFMLLLNCILKPQKGEMLFDGRPYQYNRKGLFEIRQKVGVLFQETDNQLIAPTVYEEVSFGLSNLYKDKTVVRTKTEEALANFNLESFALKKPHQLSVGQKKRVCLAAILAMEPEVVVADEPTSGLDHFYCKMLFYELDRLNQSGKTIIISTHDVNQAYEWADRIIVLDKGSALVHDETNKVFEMDEVLRKAELPHPTLLVLSRQLGLSHHPRSTIELIQLLKNCI